MTTLAEFLLARYHERYFAERGDAKEDSVREFAARIRCNMQSGMLFGCFLDRERTLRKRAATYSGHPDYDPTWTIGPSAQENG
jgi:hypothetical protein